MSIEVGQPSSSSHQHRNPKREHIAWRRERVAVLSAQGRTEREIATVLKVALGTVSNDLSDLNKQARDNLRFHV
jgi:DNA-binding NarL/FixJ family response regulator